MVFPYPVSEALLEQIITDQHPEFKIDDPAAFWALFLSCFDYSKSDAGRLTETVQRKLRRLVTSQLFFGDNGEIIGSQPTIPLQYAGNSFCLVGASIDPERETEDLALLRQHRAVMPPEGMRWQQPFTLSPNDKSMLTKARNVFVLLQDRTAADTGMHLGYCLAGGLASLISPEVLEEKARTPEKFELAAKYDNASYDPYQQTISFSDPFTDAYAIKRAAATRQTMDKMGAVLAANLHGPELDAAKAVLQDIAPNGNKQSFRAQPAATAIPDPSRILRDACPSASTIEKTKPYLDRRVYAYWTQKKDVPQHYINDFLAVNEDDDPYDPNRLRFPVSASFIGHTTPEKVAQLPIDALLGKLGRVAYKMVCVSLPALMRPGLHLYPHELNLSILSGIAFRFKKSADFMMFLAESASSIIEDIEKGNFKALLSGSNYQKIFSNIDASDEETMQRLKQIAYFNFDAFMADYLCEDKFLESAYLLPPKGLHQLTQTLDKLWGASEPTIIAAIHRFRQSQQADAQGAAMAMKA